LEEALACFTVVLYGFNHVNTVKKKGGKPDRKPYPLPYGLRPYRNLKSKKNLKIVPRNLKQIVRS
jgi:hypothetical protein